MSERTCQRPGCGNQIHSRKRRDARWCSRKCEGRATRAARRLGIELADYGKPEKLLPVGDQSLVQLHDRARPPREVTEEPAEVQADEHDLDDEPNESWSMRLELELEQQVNAIRARYASEINRWTMVYARNPGPAPRLVEIQRRMAAEIREIERAYYLQEARELAAADHASGRAQARAQERQKALTNLEGFGRDLHGARYEPVQVSKATSDIFQFPEQSSVFGSDNEVFRKSGVAQKMHNSNPYSGDGWVY